MGIVLIRAELVKGLEPITSFTNNNVRQMFNQFEAICPVPALWERAVYELFGCFDTAEQCSKAFTVLDTDGNGFIDARETLGALAILSKGHLTDRMTLLFDIFDLNKEKEMAFDECFLMLRRTMAGLKKMVSIASPPEKVIHNMTKQIWKSAKKHRDIRILPEDWFNWWSHDASCRNALKMFTWKPEDHRSLPTPDQFVHLDYAKGGAADQALDPRKRVSMSRPTSARFARRPSGTPRGSFTAEPGTLLGLPQMSPRRNSEEADQAPPPTTTPKASGAPALLVPGGGGGGSIGGGGLRPGGGGFNLLVPGSSSPTGQRSLSPSPF